MSRHRFVYRVGQWTLLLLVLGTFAALVGFAWLQDGWARKGEIAPRGGRYFFQRVELAVPSFRQGDERWRDDFLGPTQNTLGAEGCAVASAAMVFASYGIDTDPRRLNLFLNTHGGYTERGWLDWEKAAELGGGVMRRAYEDLPSYELIDREIARGNPVIVRLRLRSGITHFVVLAGKDGFDYLTRDPGAGAAKGLYPLREFGSDIEALRFLRKAVTADLFGTPEPPPRAEPRVFSVSEITRSVRAVLEEEIGTVWVEGEVTNFRKQASGHQYFTLKDAQAQLACVWFARGGFRLKQVPLADGMQVQVRGALTVYEARGQYQMNVQLVQAGGAGLAQAKFEALKRKLDAEGLFDAARKRALPFFPTTVGIVTSPTGAALRDMLNILTRRAPWLRVVVSPARVQGEGAAEEIAMGVAALNRLTETGARPVEVIVVARGGGSVEDLSGFNEEVVARAIAASKIPVVSAVGHEIDFTIADFAADLRAPTPSAAAELIAPDAAELARRIAQLAAQARREINAALAIQRSRVSFLARSAFFREPETRLNEAKQRTDFAENALRRVMRVRLDEAQRRVGDALAALRQQRPDQFLALRRQHLDAVRARCVTHFQNALRQQRSRFRRLAELLRLLAPEATLSRGYSITLKPDGTVLASVTEAKRGMRLVTRVSDGEVKSQVG